MTMRTSLTITGDTDSAQKALTDLAGSMVRTEAAAENLSGAEKALEAATGSLDAKLRSALASIGAVNDNFMGTVGAANASSRATSDAGRAATALFAAEQRLEAALASREAAQRRATAATSEDVSAQEAAAGALASANARVAAAVLGVEDAQMKVARAGGTVGKSMGEQAMGARMLGQQFQDMGVMASMSTGSATDVMRIFSTQIGQVALAVEQMGVKGAIGSTAAFLGSPWGAVILGATMVLGPFIAKLFETEQAAKLAEEGTSQLGSAQSLMGELFGKASSKIKEQNDLLRVNAQLKAVNLRAEAAEMRSTSERAFTNATKHSWGDYFSPSANGFSGTDRASNQATVLGNILRNYRAGKVSPEEALKLTEGMDFKGLNVSKQDFQKAIVDAVNAKLNDKLAGLIDQSLASGSIAPGLSKPGAAKQSKSTAARDEFGRDAADKIASIAESFSDTPDQIQKAAKAVRQLDDIIDDLGRKKPPNFAALIGSAEAAKRTVESGLIRSIAEAFDAPKTLADKAAEAFGAFDTLLAAEAAKLKKGLISPEEFEAYKRQIDASRTSIQDSLNRPYEQFIKSQEDALQIQGLISRGRYAEAEALRAILQLEKDRAPLDAAHRSAILASVQALQAEQRATDVLRQKNQKYVDALGGIKDAVMDASQAFVRGDLGQFIKTPTKLLDAFMTLQGEKLFEKIFGDLFRELEDEVNGTSVVKDASTRMAEAVDAASKSISDLGAAAENASAHLNGTAPSGAAGGITGVGAALAALISGEIDSPIVVNGRAKGQVDVFVKSIGGAVEKFASIFTNPENAKALGKSIGTFAGKGLEGAATGTFVAGISNALGIKMSSTGAQAGGAIGSFLPIPGGQIIGSIAGGLVGNLFTKPAYGTATLNSTSSAASLKGRAGAEIGAGGAAEQVQSGLESIADRLGGTLGNFAVSIGTFDGKWRVSTTGFSGQLDSKTAKGQGLKDFGKDGEAAAIAYAIQDAIADGAVQGLSAAVQKALKGNSNIDKAIAEALKVADVEKLLGGFSGELEAQFKELEKQAAERVRIARDYGFDVVKIEEINAKERLKLQKQLLDAQVGSLQQLIDEMTSGSLFEGTAVDQRTALLAEIEKAKADLDNNVDGAGDKLARLFEQLDTVSKEVYASTGGHAEDRSAILDEARAAIAKANAQIAAAQAKAAGSDPALATTNAALDENNDQNARIIGTLDDISGYLAQLVKAGILPSGSNLAALAMTS